MAAEDWRMKNSVSDHSFYIESEEEDEEKVHDSVEDNDAGNNSDSSGYSSDHDNENNQQNKPNSVSPSWPQSYRLLLLYFFCVWMRRLHLTRILDSVLLRISFQYQLFVY